MKACKYERFKTITIKVQHILCSIICGIIYNIDIIPPENMFVSQRNQIDFPRPPVPTHHTFICVMTIFMAAN